ncbi:MAG: phenylalanine--tRNA ligase subunit beta, partial [Fimbriimonadales bacterium]
MRIPIEWLKDFVQVDVSPEQLAERLTMAGLEVEAVLETPQGAVLSMYLTPNRGDCLSVFGVAREVYALLGEAARPTALFHRLNTLTLNPPPAEPSDATQYARVEVRD